MKTLPNFVVIDSVYGPFIVNRHCTYQAETLLKTGRTHIEGELSALFGIADRLPDGAALIDAGANIGLVTIPLAQHTRGRDFRILAFEPQRPLYNALCGGLVLNDIGNCEPYCLALSDAPNVLYTREVDYSAPQDFGSLSVSETGSVAVPAASIDELNVTALHLLKLDVEGWELRVLAGAKQTIEAHRPYIWVEYSTVGIDPLRAALEPFGYSCTVMDSQNLMCVPA